jgi:single-stranded-DNA-specific exonuclease
MALEHGYLLAGGGHAMAAGLTMRPSSIPEFREFLCGQLRTEMLTARLDDALDIDALVSPGAAARSIVDEFNALAPFGPGNTEPRFAMADVRVDRLFPLKGGHLRCDLVDMRGQRIKAVAWRVADTNLGRRLMTAGGSIHIAGKLRLDDWNGRDGVQLEIEDAADLRRTP